MTSFRAGFRLTVLAGPAVALTALAACSADAPSAPRLAVTAAPPAGAGPVEVCHFTKSAPPQVLRISYAAIAAHAKHGDHPALLVVDPASPFVGDRVHFARITDALAAARATRVDRNERQAAACRITIAVAPGVFRGSAQPSADPAVERLPLVVDVPDLTLRGAFRMELDAAGRATGRSAGGVATTLSPSPGLTTAPVPQPVIAVSDDPAGFRGNGAVIEGFVFQSGHVGTDNLAGGQGVWSLRVTGLVVRGNRFEAKFTESIDLRASSGVVETNHLGGGDGTCDICLAGPGAYTATGNYLLAGGIPGILISPTTQLPVPTGIAPYVLPASAAVDAVVTNNHVQDHLRKPPGVGVRVTSITLNGPNVAGFARAQIHGNELVNNNFAVIMEAGFPIANTLLKGDMDVTLGGNTFLQSCQHDVFVSFSRHQTGLLLQNAPYIRSSTYTLALGGDVAPSDVWYAHPAGQGNTFTMDGALMPNGNTTAYTAAKTCAPLP